MSSRPTSGRPADATERAYHDIRGRIVDGELASGSPLREAALSRAIGVSRTPVRAALVRLHAEGLVEIVPKRGAFVAAWSTVDLEEIFGLRVVLESYGARLAATKIQAPEIEALRQLADRMDEELAARRPDYVNVCTELNVEFHLALMRAGGNQRLEALLRGLYEQPLLHRTIGAYSGEQLRRAWEQHRELIGAMETRDPDRAAIVMSAHLLAGRAVMVQAERPPTPKD